MTCSFKEYPVVDEVPRSIYSRPPIFANFEGNVQQHITIAMYDRVGYQGLKSQQYLYNPFMNVQIKQVSLSSPVFPQYYQYHNPQPRITPDMKTTTTTFEQAARKGRTRRLRTVFTQDQLDILEEAFKVSRYVSLVKRMDLSKVLDLTDDCILTWFRNRRCKQKRLEAKTGRLLVQNWSV